MNCCDDYDMSEHNSAVKECQTLMCGICRSILILPVTLPCGHHMCLDCFKKSKELVNLLCPFCRLRISCWARNAKNQDNKLIDWNKWNLIKEKFADLVHIRTSDNDWSDLFDDEIFGSQYASQTHTICSDGDIRKELDQISRKESERLLAEEKASKDLIEQILAEDNKALEEHHQNLMQQMSNDEQIARTLVINDSKKETVIKTLRNRTYLSE